MKEDFIAKETEIENLRERPELPDDVEGDDIDSMGIIGPGGNYRRQILYPSRQNETDPMLPLIYFSTGVFSTLLAFLVFYLCMRCSHKHKNCESPKVQLADKKD